MSLVGALKVALQLETAAFEKGTKRAAAEIDAFGSKAEKAGFAVGRAGKAIVAAGGVIAGSMIAAKVKDLVTQGLEYASALGEQAKQLGVSAKALQEYRFIATQVGVSTGEMDQGLAKLTRTMGEAVQGAKPAREAFGRIGIDIDAFVASGKDAGDLIPLIAEGMKGLGSEAERQATMVDLFGRAGQKLAPLLDEGGAGINRLRDAAQRLGVVLSSEQIQKADDAADKLAAVKTVLEARIAGVVADNANSILRLADGLSSLVDKLFRLIGLLQRLDSTPLRRLAEVANLINPVALAARGLGVVSGALDAADRRGATSSPARVPSSGGALLRLPPKTLAPVNPAFLKGGGGSSLLRKPGYAGGGMDLGGTPWGEFAPGPMAEGMAFLERKAGDAGRSLEQAAKLSKRSWADAANSIVASLGGLASALQGGGGGFLGVLSSVVGLGLQLGSAGLFGKGIAANINAPGRANGGPVMANRLYTVGERGPELFVPQGAGRIVPNHALGGGVTNNYFTLPSDEFWGHVDGRIGGHAPAIARGGASLAQRQSARAAQWQL